MGVLPYSTNEGNSMVVQGLTWQSTLVHSPSLSEVKTQNKMKTLIRYYSRSVYGSIRNYIADPIQNEALFVLTNGAKSLEDRHFAALAKLGFTIEQVIDPVLVAKSARYGATLV